MEGQNKMVKKGLGRGLESLFAMYDEEIGNKNITNKVEKETPSKAITKGVNEIEISKIFPNPNQPRKNFDPEALEELSKSIKVHGVIQPIVLNEQADGRYMIIAGERRYRASKLAGLNVIPAIVKNYTDRQIKEISIIENLQREDLNPIESAKAIKQLMEEYRLTQEEVADRIGKSRSNIANTLRLLSLYPDVIKLVENGILSAGHARCLVVINNPTDQIRLANQTVKEKWNVRDLEKAVKKAQNPTHIAQKTIVVQSIELKELIEKMQKTFATKVSAIGNDNKGRIYIDYYTRDDLDRLSDLLSILNNK
jgi:ParB family chromosome partitioning protein